MLLLIKIVCITLRYTVGLCLLILSPEEDAPHRSAHFTLLVWIWCRRAAFTINMDVKHWSLLCLISFSPFVYCIQETTNWFRISLFLHPIEHNGPGELTLVPNFGFRNWWSSRRNDEPLPPFPPRLFFSRISEERQRFEVVVKPSSIDWSTSLRMALPGMRIRSSSNLKLVWAYEEMEKYEKYRHTVNTKRIVLGFLGLNGCRVIF